MERVCVFVLVCGVCSVLCLIRSLSEIALSPLSRYYGFITVADTFSK